jgi:hypothetical protein
LAAYAATGARSAGSFRPAAVAITGADSSQVAAAAFGPGLVSVAVPSRADVKAAM